VCFFSSLEIFKCLPFCFGREGLDFEGPSLRERKYDFRESLSFKSKDPWFRINFFTLEFFFLNSSIEISLKIGGGGGGGRALFIEKSSLYLRFKH